MPQSRPPYEARIDSVTGLLYVKRHDAQSGLTLRPLANPLVTSMGSEAAGRSGAVVFPSSGGDSAVVLTPRERGVEEDILLTQPRGDRLVFEWELTIEPGMVARLDGAGNVRVYGPAISPWGDIQISDDKSRELIEKARNRAAKDQLLYCLPAPVIRQANGVASKDRARIELDSAPNVIARPKAEAISGQQVVSSPDSSQRLTVRLIASGVSRLAYPINIDPTVLIDTTQGFALGGNIEGGVDIGSNRVKRGTTSVGVGAWNASTAFPTSRSYPASLAYNGFLYVIGGYDGTNPLNDVQVAPINADGTIGTWTATTPFTTGRYAHASVAYDGNLYVIGGNAISTTLNDVQFAPINADGTLGSWTTTTSFTTPRYSHAGVASGGFIYILGGEGPSGVFSDVQFAPVKGDGTLGAWTATTPLTTARFGHTSVAYNGRLYVVGGNNGVNLGDVQVAPINVDGTVGAWSATTPFVTARFGHASVAYDGYLYVIGGGAYLGDVQAAPIFANGSLGTWTETNALSTARADAASVAYDGHVYVIGGVSAGLTYLNDVQVAPINQNGAVTGWTTATAFPSARFRHATVAYDGYLYVIGGSGNGVYFNDVEVAPILANGTLGPWRATTPFTTPRDEHSSVAYNGFLYILGGFNGTIALGDVQVAPINPDGTIGAWATTTAFTTPRWEHTTIAYDGYLYLVGGYGGGFLNDVQAAPINPGGMLGKWTPTTAFSTGRESHASVAYNGNLYVIGGGIGGGYLNDVQVAPIFPNGSVGGWTTTTAFNTARDEHTSIAYNGYLYVIGGIDTGGAGVSDVQVAPINGDGTLGTWMETAALTAGRFGHTSAIDNGLLYVLGGLDDSGADLNDVQVGSINANGTAGAWTTTTPLSIARDAHASVAFNGFLYVLGGNSNAGPLSDVQFTAVNANGTVGAWTATTAFNTARFGHASIAYNGYLYVIGGSATNLLDDVQFAPINEDGTVGSFAPTTTLPSVRSSHTSVAYNGYLYVIGGIGTGSTYLNDVQVAPINQNGTIGSWTATTAFVNGRSEHASVIYDGYLYVIGGQNGATLGDVQAAPINSNGTLGSWITTTAFTPSRFGHTSVVNDGYLYVIGGSSGPSNLSDVQVAPVNSNGTVGAWTSTTALSPGRALHSSVAYDGYVFILGGSWAAGILNEVQSAPLLTPAAVGNYSTLVDLGTTASLVDSVTVIGSAFAGTVSLQYRTAPSSGVFGATTSKGAVPLGTAVPLGDTNVEYLWLMLTLDDTGATTINPDSTSQRDVTSITVSYGSVPPPDAGSSPDAGRQADAGSLVDAGFRTDAGVVDSGTAADASVGSDAGSEDSGVASDSGRLADAGATGDAGSAADAGEPTSLIGVSCGCAAGGGSAALGPSVAVFIRLSRRRRRSSAVVPESKQRESEGDNRRSDRQGRAQ
jgi:N-acetylneuraminic acid mutarotase